MLDLTMLLRYYDREVAAALFEPMRAEIEQTNMANWPTAESSSWRGRFSIPRRRGPDRAVARTKGLRNDSFAGELVADMLVLSSEERWRRIWSLNTEMSSMLDRDIR